MKYSRVQNGLWKEERKGGKGGISRKAEEGNQSDQSDNLCEKPSIVTLTLLQGYLYTLLGDPPEGSVSH